MITTICNIVLVILVIIMNYEIRKGIKRRQELREFIDYLMTFSVETSEDFKNAVTYLKKTEERSNE